jgi:hypothetical protein
MFAGLLRKCAEWAAVAAATSIIVGGVVLPTARAADFATDCCADLEQRVADLEATAARKGNRKMSLTIAGQVDKVIMWWDDGQSSKTYYGLENGNATTRLSIFGDAKVAADVKIGFEIMLDNQSGTSAGVNQWDANGKNNDLITPLGAPSFTSNNNDNYFGAARRMFVWIEDAKLGRISVGRNYMAGAVTTIDLAGISAGADDSLSQINGSFSLRGPAGQYYDVLWKNLTIYSTNPPRQNEVRYDAPSIAGFIFSASLADDGSNYGTMLRYLNEVRGFRIAAGIGYEHYGQVTAQPNCVVFAGVCQNPPGSGPANQANPAPNVNAWGAGLSLLYVPSGLFVQGHYVTAHFDEDAPTTAAPGNGFWFQNKAGLIAADQWLIQCGINKNWLGFGNTAVFGEYSKNNGWGAGGGPQAASGIDYSASTTPGAQSVFGVSNTELTMFGFGIQQNLDAAATELFLDARRFSVNITCSATGANCTGAAAAIGSVPLAKLQTEDFWAVVGGARVKF